MKANNIFSLIIVGMMLICVRPVYSQEQAVKKLQLPMTPTKEDIVHLDLALKIASIKAQKHFGQVVPVNPIIGYGLNGSVRVYIVPFKIGGGIFPSEEEIIRQMNEAKQFLPEAKRELAEVREASLKRGVGKFEKRGDRVFLEKCPEWNQAEERVEELKNKQWGIGEYGTVIVSARKDLVPILEFSNTLPYYYTYRKLAEEKAKESLMSPSVSLIRFYYSSSLNQIFEFKSPTGEKIWIAMFPPRVVKPGKITDKRLEVTEKEKEWIQKKWSKVMEKVHNESFNLSSTADHWVGGRDDVVPAYLWTAGCAPTSATMVLGYYDWDSPTGRYTSYGKLVPYYFDKSVISNYTDHSGDPYNCWPGYDVIPYTVYPLAWGMHTEATTGGTPVGQGVINIKYGTLYRTNTQCDYSFSSSEHFEIWDWDNIWNKIKQAVNGNHPCIWSRTGSWPHGDVGHSVTVIGYSDGGDVYYRCTHDFGWHSSPYQGNGQSWADITTVTPGGGSGGNDVELLVPDGGENWEGLSAHDIQWEQFGSSINKIHISYSPDAGYAGTKTWYYIVQDYPTSEGENSYSWTLPDISTIRDVFVKIEAYSGGTYIASEGSEGRFTITRCEPHMTVSPDPYDYDSVFVGSSKNVTFTVSNIAFCSLHVSSISMINDIANAFSVIGDTFFTVAPNDSDTIVVKFAPTSEGIKSVKLKIKSDDADTPTKYISLIGYGKDNAAEELKVILPKAFYLSQNLPNPAISMTRIPFGVPKEAHITLAIYDISGKKVRILMARTVAVGHHIINWDGKDDNGKRVSRGIYFYRLETGKFKATRKLTILR